MVFWMLATTMAVSAAADTTRMDVTQRIGDEAGVVFGQVEAVEVAADGTIYVLDGFDKQVRAFTSEGVARWSVGREGQGPGEFDSPVGLTWAPDGSLWVIDPGNQRVTAFDPNGKPVGSHRIQSGFSLAPWPGRFDRQGRFYHYAELDGESYGFGMAIYNDAMARIDLVRPPVAPEEEAYFEGRTERGSHMRARVPFTPHFTWRLNSRGQFVSNWSATLRFHGPFGTSQPMDTGPEMGPVVTREARQHALESLSAFTRRGGRIQPERIPNRRPVVATFVLDDADRIWALRTSPSSSRSSVFEVFDSQGQHVTTVALAATISIHPTIVIRNGWMAGVEVGPFGQQTVVLARLPESLR